MTTEHETLRIIGSWMEDGRTRLPEHVLDAVLDQLPATRQHRPGWSGRRITHMNALTKYATGAAAVVVVAIAGFNLVGSPGPGAGGVQPPPSRSPSPSASPVATASEEAVPVVPTSGAIDPGRYRWTAPGGEVAFVLAEGWTAHGINTISRNYSEVAAPGPTEVSFTHNLPYSTYAVTHVYADACHSASSLKPVGKSADDLLAALDAQQSTDVLVTDVTAGSAVGKRVEITDAEGVDRSKCRYGKGSPLQIWADPAETGFFALAPGHRGVAYVFDVDGTRFVFSAAFGPASPEADVAAIAKIVQSLEFSTP